MLWSQLKDWPDHLHYPPEVRRAGRMATYIDAREGDLTGWRFPKMMALMAFDERIGPLTRVELERRQEMVEAIEEIDHVLRWMRNTDWPFR